MVKWILVMKIQPSICFVGLGKPRKNPSQVGRHRDSNPGPTECESRALPRSHLVRYQQYYMPSQHMYCEKVWNLIQASDVQSSD